MKPRNNLYRTTTVSGSSKTYPPEMFFANSPHALRRIVISAHVACQRKQCQIFFESRHAIALNLSVASVDKQMLWFYDPIVFIGR